mgnify:CR=1 FL=1
MRYRLLAAEDEPQLRMMLWDYFTAKDFDVTTCRDGEEALAKLEEQAFDIVFLDIMMPKLDGLTVCRALRRENPVPVIFLTARSRFRSPCSTRRRWRLSSGPRGGA